MTTTDLRNHLIAIIVKGAARGNGGPITTAQAEKILDALISSDDHPCWDEIREGREQMHHVIDGYLR